MDILEREAFRVLAMPLWCLLLRAARKVCRRRESEAEDAASDVLQGILHRPTDRAFVRENADAILAGHLPGMLGIRVRVRAKKHLHSKGGQPLDQEQLEAKPIESRSADPQFLPAETFGQALAVDLQRLLQLRLDGKTQKEIAAECGKSERTIRGRVRALKKRAEQAGLTPSWRPQRL